jgi:ferredoxin-NADP reductase
VISGLFPDGFRIDRRIDRGELYMAMLRHRRHVLPELPMRLVYSVSFAEDVIYADELGDGAVITSTRPPDGWTGHRGRIDSAPIAEPGAHGGIVFNCGSNPFVDAAADLALGAGFRPEQIRTERCGPTG